MYTRTRDSLKNMFIKNIYSVHIIIVYYSLDKTVFNVTIQVMTNK